MRDGVTRQDGTGEAAGSPAGPDDHGWDDSLYNDRAVAKSHTLPRRADGQDGADRRPAGERAPRSRRRRIFRWAAITVSLTILGTAGASWAYLNHLVPKEADAARIWSMIRNDIPFDANSKAKTTTGGTPGATPTASAATPGPSAAPVATIPVSVVNGTAGGSGIPVSGRAGALAKTLADAGFSKAAASPTQQPSAGTVLSYPAKDGGQGRADALAVAAILKLPKNVVKKSVQGLVHYAAGRSGLAGRYGLQQNPPKCRFGSLQRAGN